MLSFWCVIKRPGSFSGARRDLTLIQLHLRYYRYLGMYLLVQVRIPIHLGIATQGLPAQPSVPLTSLRHARLKSK